MFAAVMNYPVITQKLFISPAQFIIFAFDLWLPAKLQYTRHLSPILLLRLLSLRPQHLQAARQWHPKVFTPWLTRVTRFCCCSASIKARNRQMRSAHLATEKNFISGRLWYRCSFFHLVAVFPFTRVSSTCCIPKK